MKYPAGDPEGQKLFAALEERAGKKRYDDDFLLMLIDYQRMYPESEHFDIFYGRYAAHHGNHAVALESAERAFRKRKVCLEVWKLLIECYLALGMPEKAVPLQGYCSRFYGETPNVTVPVEELPKYLGELGVSMGDASYAPLCRKKCSLKDGILQTSEGVFGGEMLPFSSDEEGYGYWVGAYNESGWIGGHGKLLEAAAGWKDFMEAAGVDFVYDIIRSKETKEADICPEGGTLLLPIASAEGNQQVRFRRGDTEDTAILGQWEYGWFRLDEPVRVSGDRPLSIGRPVPLGHSPRRRKFILNILVDAFSWNAFRQMKFQHMPHVMEFFSEGVIFDQHFSVGEYTYPSLATIETGMYPHHSQIFHERATVRLDGEYKTMSEKMKELGYYCVNVMGGGDGLYNGVTRGYDRLLVSAYDMPAYAGAERVIRHLETFSECDQFLFLHLMECHPWSSKSFPLGMGAQAEVSLEDRLNGQERKVASVYLPNTPIYQAANRHAMVYVDRALGTLFRYVREHYDEEEYVIQLYSDHGAPIYDEHPSILSDNQTNAAYMLRGRGVPAKGMVEELTSAVDIYPTLAHLAGFAVGEWVDGNLPEVFGGRAREYVYSNSVFPGQTYKLCIRSKEHECNIESREPVNEDGTADLSGGEVSIRRRDSREEVEDAALTEKFLRAAGEYTKTANNGGRQWKSLVEARPEWYGKKNGEKK